MAKVRNWAEIVESGEEVETFEKMPRQRMTRWDDEDER